jgi:AraC-like DNA-binding protein
MLHRELLGWTGLPPKHLARVFRMQRALREVRTGHLQLAAVAQMAGYADQAHMANEFRALAAAPPTSFRSHPNGS